MKLKFASSVVLACGIFVAACGGGGGSTSDVLKKTTAATESKINSPTGTFDQAQAATVGATAAATASSGLGGLAGAFGGAAGGSTGSAPSGLEAKTVDIVLSGLDVMARAEDAQGLNCAGAQKAMSGGGDGSGECGCQGGGKIVFESKNVSAFSSLKVGKGVDPASFPTATLVVGYQGCKIAQQGISISIDGGLALQSEPNKLIVGMDLTYAANYNGQSQSASFSFGYGYVNGDIWVLVESPKGNTIAVATGKYDPATKSGEIKVKDKNGTTVCTVENGTKKECHAG